MKNKNWASRKLLICVFMFVFLIFIYCFTIPNNSITNKPYTFNFTGMLYMFIAIGAILIIDFEKISVQEYIIALCIGIISVGVTVPIHILGIISGVCAACSYLAARTLSQSYENRIRILRSSKLHDILIDFVIIFAMGCLFVLLHWLTNDLEIQIQFNIVSLIRAMGAAVSEEFIFRMFLYSLILKCYDGDEPSRAITFSVIILPFVMLHVVEEIIMFGFLYVIPNVIFTCLLLIPFAILFVKRDLLTVIGLHFVYNLVNMILVV